MTPKLEATPAASARTRNRCREHNLMFLHRGTAIITSGREPAVFAACQDHGCDWEGWLPENEIM